MMGKERGKTVWLFVFEFLALVAMIGTILAWMVVLDAMFS
jgi:hypothetical protein